MGKRSKTADSGINTKRAAMETTKRTSQDKDSQEGTAIGSRNQATIPEGDFLTDYANKKHVAARKEIDASGAASAQESCKPSAQSSGSVNPNPMGSDENIENNNSKEQHEGTVTESREQNSGEIGVGDKEAEISEHVIGGRQAVKSGDGAGLDKGENSGPLEKTKEGPRCSTRICTRHPKQEAPTRLEKIFRLPQALGANLFKPKYTPSNPLDILVGRMKNEILQVLQRTLSNMGGTSFKSIYFWDVKQLGILPFVGNLVRETGIKTETKVFTLDMLHTEIVMNEQCQRINETIENAIQQAYTSPCILFIERIDRLLYSVGPAKELIDCNLDHLLHYPILLVATSTKPFENAKEMHKLFFGHTIFHLRSESNEQEKEIMKLFYQVFMKNVKFAQKASEVAGLANPPLINCVDCLKYHFGENFTRLMKNIFEVCENRTAIFIKYVYEMLSQKTELDNFKVASYENYFHTVDVEINNWKAKELPMAVRVFDR